MTCRVQSTPPKEPEMDSAEYRAWNLEQTVRICILEGDVNIETIKLCADDLLAHYHKRARE